MSYDAIRMLAQRQTLTVSKGSIEIDTRLVEFLSKKGKYERFLEYTGKAVKSEELLKKGTVAWQLRECVGQRYLGYYEHYRAALGVEKRELAMAYAQVAALLVWFRRADWESRRQMYELLPAMLQDGVFSFPSGGKELQAGNKMALQSWFSKHKNTKELELIHGNNGKQNALKFGNNEDIVGWAVDLCADGHNYPVPAIVKMLAARCEWFGYEAPSESWVKNLRLQWQATIAEYRWDERNPHLQAYRIYIPTAKAPYAGTVWTIDGTQFNAVAHETEKGKSARLYYIAVRDEFSGDVLAVVPCYAEDVAVHIAVVKAAIAETGYVPYELRHDRFTGHNGAVWLEFIEGLKALGLKKVTTTVSPWAKGRHERMYGTLQSVFDAFSKVSYRDSPLSTRPTARVRNSVMLQQEKVARKTGYDWQKAVADLAQVITAYRHTPYSKWSEKYRSCEKSPAELHYLSEKPHATMLAPQEIALLTWEKHSLTPAQGYLSYKENYINYMYRLTPELMYDVPRQKVNVYINAEHRESVHVFLESGEYMGELLRQEEVLTAGPEADWAALHEAKAHTNRLKEYAKAKFEAVVSKGAKQHIDQETGEVTPIAYADEAASLLGGRVEKERVAAAEEFLLRQYSEPPKADKKAKPAVSPEAEEDDLSNFFLKYAQRESK